MPTQTPKTYRAERPLRFMPAALDSPSGTLEMKTAASTERLTEPPPSRPSRRTTDSGTPSSSAPIAMAAPLPDCSFSDGCWSPDRFRCRAPRRARTRFAARYTTAPHRKPRAVAGRPPTFAASSMRSKATAEMSTPEPNAMTEATILGGTAMNQAMRAPMTSAPPPSRPHSPASSQVGMKRSLPCAMVAEPRPRPGHRPELARGGGRGPLSVGVAKEVATEVRDGEGDLPALGGVDEPLLDQRVAGGGEGRRFAAQREGDLGRAVRRAPRTPQLRHGVHVLALGRGRPVVARAEEADGQLGLGDGRGHGHVVGGDGGGGGEVPGDLAVGLHEVGVAVGGPVQRVEGGRLEFDVLTGGGGPQGPVGGLPVEPVDAQVPEQPLRVALRRAEHRRQMGETRADDDQRRTLLRQLVAGGADRRDVVGLDVLHLVDEQGDPVAD